MQATADDELVRSEGELPGPGGALYFRAVRPAAPWARLAIVHGYGDHSGRYREFMEWLAATGVGCAAVDLRGQGKAAGRSGFVHHWEDYLDDVDAFLESGAVRELGGAETPLFVLGHSHGGLVVTAATLRSREDVAGYVLSAPFFRNRMRVPLSKVVLSRLVDPVFPWLPVPIGLRDEWMSRDESQVRESGTDPLIVRVATPRWFLGCRRVQEEVFGRAPEFRDPVLVLVGDADPISDPRAVHDFFLNLGSSDKTFRLYPDRLHELLRESNRLTIYEHIRAWVRERVPDA
jgi:lysophospholipase